MDCLFFCTISGYAFYIAIQRKRLRDELHSYYYFANLFTNVKWLVGVLKDHAVVLKNEWG